MAKPLIVFEMANNHNGSVEHGVKIVREFAEVAASYRDHFDFGFKLQYRDLDTYIHQSHRGTGGYVKRFEDTRLTREQFQVLLDAMRALGLKTICTPFDEPSVAHVVEDRFDFIKIASACFGDWPLMEAVAGSGLPVIASTGGATTQKIWDVAAFFRHRNIPLTLLHCVAEYPTPENRFNLRQIEALRKLHPSLGIGFSTHESQRNMRSIGLALALGASVIEKHVGIGKLNDYSCDPFAMKLWMDHGVEALKMLGGSERTSSDEEQASLASLRRGVYAKRPLPEGTLLTENDVCFAFPAGIGQLTANDWSKYINYTSKHSIPDGSPITLANLHIDDMHDRLHHIARNVYEMVTKSGVVVPSSAALEISHHYGLDEFENTGISMFTLVNGKYCKKILLMLPGQFHPEQHHEKKEETFVILHGEMVVCLDGVAQIVRRGDVVTIKPGVGHALSTRDGVVFEEISTEHNAADSFYTDPAINGNAHRKTFITHWTNV